MKKLVKYQGKKVLVLGLAKSGVSAAKLLHSLGAEVTVNDRNLCNDNEDAKGLRELGIQVICGEHPLSLLDEDFTLIVKNPGIPYTIPFLKRAINKTIPIITEVELAYGISEAEFVAVTGTNGKTTTTTLIYELLKADDARPLIAGNIGTVASDVAQLAEKGQQIVIELSSFQLMGIAEFRPKIAVLTNLYEAHLDYHGTREEYVKAKKRIVQNQTDQDYFIYNYRQKECRVIAKSITSNTIPFSTEEYLSGGACILDGWVMFQGEKIIPVNQIVLPGSHNLENILAAVAAAKLLGVSNKSVKSVLTTFTGVKHRLQFIRELNGRVIYNDSKATNILATKTALASFNQPIILLAGGLDRGNEFDELLPHLNQVKVLITFGETKDKLKEVGKLAGIETIITVDNVEEAVPVAYEFSAPGDVILLSPACASWDQYKSFEVRGDMFIQAVHKLE